MLQVTFSVPPRPPGVKERHFSYRLAHNLDVVTRKLAPDELLVRVEAPEFAEIIVWITLIPYHGDAIESDRARYPAAPPVAMPEAPAYLGTTEL